MDEVMATMLPTAQEDGRGGSYGLKTRLRDDFTAYYRSAGTVSGNHSHRWRIPKKNPDAIVFLEEGLFDEGRFDSDTIKGDA